jgi:hypothetical protein
MEHSHNKVTTALSFVDKTLSILIRRILRDVSIPYKSFVDT